LYALRKIGPAAKGAIPALMKRMQADSSFDADAAAWALARVAPNDAAVHAAVLAKLKKGIASADEQTQMESIEALSDIGAAAQAKAELERAAKEDGSPLVRAAAEAALKK
jgi:HEAT repeat protein